MLAGLAIQPNLDQQVSLISRTLISRPDVEKLVQMADLDLQSRRPAERDGLIDDVMNTIRLTGGAATNRNVITATGIESGTGEKVIQSLLTIFVESSLGDKRQDSRSASQDHRRPDQALRGYLQASETRLKDFRLKYLGVAGRDGQDYFARLSALSANIDGAKLELEAAQESRDSYKHELAGETATFLPDQ